MDRQHLEDLRSELENITVVIADKYKSSFWPYGLTSTARREARLDEDLVNTVFEQAEGAIDSAAQHMSALHRTLDTSRVVVLPCFTIARTILEGCGRASWLLDPRLESTDRFARSIALLLQERRAEPRIVRSRVDENTKEGREQVESAQKSWETERDKIAEKAENIGIELRRDDKDSVNKVGDYSPELDFTTIVTASLNEEEAYRTLSSLAHQRTYRQKEMTTKSVPIAGIGRSRQERAMKEEQYTWIVQSAIRWYANATWKSFSYSGYDLQWMADTLRKAGATLGLAEDFWKQPIPTPRWD